MMTVEPTTHRFPRRQLATLAELAEARSAFTDWLGSFVGSSERVEELSVVVSELGANAVHGTPAGCPPASVHAWTDGPVLTIEVVNRVSEAEQVHDGWDLKDPLRTGGRGLLLVSAFVDDVQVDVDGDLLVLRTLARL